MALHQRALLLVHPYFRPDRKKARSQTEKDVWLALKRMKFDVLISTAQGDLRELDRDLAAHRPHFVFNLLEEFRDEGVYDFHAVSFLEAREIPVTGCNPRGMVVSRNKLWTAQIARGAGVRSPKSWQAASLAQAREAPFPLILKFINEHASLGMTLKNVVRDPRQLKRRMRELSSFGAELMAQEFISGQELSVGVAGNGRPVAFHPRELRMRSDDMFVTEKVKFSEKFRWREKITARYFKGDKNLIRDLKAASCRLFKALNLSGYARFDYRLDRAGNFFLIDVNANPNLARDEDFALSAKFDGTPYEELLGKIIRLAKEYTATR